MRIIILGTVPNDLLNFRADLIKDFLKNGHEVIASSSKLDPSSTAHMNKLGIEYETIFLNRHGLNFIGDIRTLQNLSSFFKKKQPDLILAHGIKLVIWGGISARIRKIPFLIKSQKNERLAWTRAADAIRTTDTYAKYHSEIVSSKDSLFINGIAKGSGMIQPNMATMLSFIFTNTDILNKKVESGFKEIINKTFNSISVDGDTSTSDMVLLFSVNNKKLVTKSKEIQTKFLEKLEMLMTTLSHLIVKDGEGASKFITVEVVEAKNDEDARKVARSIINSPLMKTAMAGSDSNWGRIIMAIGKTDAQIFPEKISLSFGKYLILDKGNKFISKNVLKINKYLKKSEIKINISLGLGSGNSKMWTCDLTKDYISINADYRS